MKKEQDWKPCKLTEDGRRNFTGWIGRVILYQTTQNPDMVKVIVHGRVNVPYRISKNWFFLDVPNPNPAPPKTE